MEPRMNTDLHRENTSRQGAKQQSFAKIINPQMSADMNSHTVARWRGLGRNGIFSKVIISRKPINEAMS